MIRWGAMSQRELTTAQASHSFCDCPIRLSSLGCHEYLQLLMPSTPQEGKWLSHCPLHWCQDHAKLCI